MLFKTLAPNDLDFVNSLPISAVAGTGILSTLMEYIGTPSKLPGKVSNLDAAVAVITSKLFGLSFLPSLPLGNN